MRAAAHLHRARDAFGNDGDEENVHRLRVSLRRLRALARLAEPYLRRPAGVTDRAFRRAGALLAPLRDCDVALAALRAAATGASPHEREVLGRALDRLLRDRRAEVRRVRRALRARPTTELIDALDAWGGRVRAKPLGTVPADRGAAALARAGAERLLTDRTWGRHLRSADVGSRSHRLRRRVRRTRYQLEALATALGREAPLTLHWLVEVQSALGEMQDAAAVSETLQRSARGRAAMGGERLEAWRTRMIEAGSVDWDRIRAGRVAWRRSVRKEYGPRST